MGSVNGIVIFQVAKQARDVPRELQVKYPGANYHVMSREDRREPIFKDGEDPERFLATLTEETSTNPKWRAERLTVKTRGYLTQLL